MTVTPAAVIQIDEAAAAGRLAKSLRFKTISSLNPAKQALDEFDQLHAHLIQAFPLIHSKLKRETIGAASLLYKWEGSDVKAKPIMLMAHQDVVPIAPDTEKNWQHAPFDGVISGSYIWGRGAWEPHPDAPST